MQHTHTHSHKHIQEDSCRDSMGPFLTMSQSAWNYSEESKTNTWRYSNIRKAAEVRRRITTPLILCWYWSASTSHLKKIKQYFGQCSLSTIKNMTGWQARPDQQESSTEANKEQSSLKHTCNRLVFHPTIPQHDWAMGHVSWTVIGQ